MLYYTSLGSGHMLMEHQRHARLQSTGIVYIYFVNIAFIFIFLMNILSIIIEKVKYCIHITNLSFKVYKR